MLLITPSYSDYRAELFCIIYNILQQFTTLSLISSKHNICFAWNFAGQDVWRKKMQFEAFNEFEVLCKFYN